MALPFSSMVLKLGLNGSLAPGAMTLVAWQFLSAKALREQRFFSKPDRDALQAVMLFSARTPLPAAAGNAKPCWWRWLILALRGAPGRGMTLSLRGCEIKP